MSRFLSSLICRAFTYIISATNAEILRLPYKHFANFSIIMPHIVLQGSVIATLLYKSERECRIDCMMNRLCKSFNRENQGDQRCELNNRTFEDILDNNIVVFRLGWTLHSTDYDYPLVRKGRMLEGLPYTLSLFPFLSCPSLQYPTQKIIEMSICRKSSIKAPGGLFNFGPCRGRLNREGGLFTKSNDKDIFGSVSVLLSHILLNQHTISYSNT